MFSLSNTLHLKPTKIHPEIFLTIQKSITHKIDTKTKIITEEKSQPKNKYVKIENALKNKVIKQIKGLPASAIPKF